MTGRDIWAHWMTSDNFGDRLTPWLIHRLTGRRPVWSDEADVDKIMVCGSILNHARRNTTVWGAGLACLQDRVLTEGVKIAAVRGPLTRAVALAWGVPCPEVFGDPALFVRALLPPFTPPPPRERKIAVVYHYVDGFRANEWWRDRVDVQLVDPFWPVENYCAAIASARGVVSSSLHGVIVADSYGVPRVWAKFSDSVGGDGTKFRDHDLGVGLKTQEAVDLRSAIPKQNLVDLPYRTAFPGTGPFSDPPILRDRLKTLLDACPLPVTDEARRLVLAL